MGASGGDMDSLDGKCIRQACNHGRLTVPRIFSGLVPVRVTVGYAVMLVLVATTLLALGPRVQHRVVRHMSTNLHNLGQGHLGTLLGSAFVTAGGEIYLGLPGLVCLLALAELLWHSQRLLLALALGHIGATLIVAAGLATAIRFGWLPTSVTRASDVGISYGAVAVLGTLTAAIPDRWRPAWIGWWLAIGLMAAASDEDFTAVGHCVALVAGMLLSARFRSAVHWTPLRLVLLAGGVWFGYLTLVGFSLLTAPVAGLAAVLIALIAQRAARRQRSRRVHQPVAVPALENANLVEHAPEGAAAGVDSRVSPRSAHRRGPGSQFRRVCGPADLAVDANSGRFDGRRHTANQQV
jgi:hypothetical protein